MSANGDGDDDGPGRREVAYRLFAAEFEDADLEYSESDEERAPNYVVTPTGGRVNRLFAVGVLTEVESVSDDVLRGRLVDPTGAFVMYAGQYQQDERAFLDRADPPAFVAVTGKARTFQPEDSDRVFTSVRPESLSEVDADTRDRWTVAAAEQTIDRVQAMATAIALDAEGDRLEDALLDRGVEAGFADGIVQALAHYGTTPTYLAAVRELAVDAARHVAGDVDEVPGLDVAPSATGDVHASDLLAEPVEPLGEPAGGDDAEAESDSQDQTATSESEPATAATGGTESTGTASAAGSADSTASTASTAETNEADETATAEPTEPVEPAGSGESDGPADAAESAESAAASESTEAAESATASEPTEAAESAETTESPDASETPGGDTDEGPGDFDPGEFDLDEEEREEIEEEYGTEFQSGTEVEDPGEADIETPDPEEIAEGASGDATAESSAESDPVASESGASDPEATEAGASASAATADTDDSSEETSEETSDESQAEPPAESAEDVDLIDAVVDVMGELDEGDGADRGAVVETIADRHGADPDDVEDAVQDALMDGRCYEPDDGVLKPI